MTFWASNLSLYMTAREKLFFFFLIGNQRTVINEKKWKVQVVHDDEQQATEETNSKTKDKEIRKII